MGQSFMSTSMYPFRYCSKYLYLQPSMLRPVLINGRLLLYVEIIQLYINIINWAMWQKRLNFSITVVLFYGHGKIFVRKHSDKLNPICLLLLLAIFNCAYPLLAMVTYRFYDIQYLIFNKLLNISPVYMYLTSL